MDNYLGDLRFASAIDNLNVVGRVDAAAELIPVSKLDSYLVWREKEFVEKYRGIRRNTESDQYTSFEATLKSGKPLLAIVNSDLLAWSQKASHPWMMTVTVNYTQVAESGMPGNEQYKLMDIIEDEIMAVLKDADGYLNVGRETGDGVRTVYFACNAFRKVSVVMKGICDKYQGSIKIDYDIFKDKYWRSLSHFMN